MFLDIHVLYCNIQYYRGLYTLFLVFYMKMLLFCKITILYQIIYTVQFCNNIDFIV